MASEFESIQSLLQQVHAGGPEEPQLSPEEVAAAEAEKRRAAIERFKKEVLENRLVIRRLRKYRHEGLYAVRPWQWVTIIVGTPLLLAGAAYFVRAFSDVTRANIAIRNGLSALYLGDIPKAMDFQRQALAFGANEANVRLQFGKALSEMERPDSALEEFDRARVVAREAGDYAGFVTAGIRAAEIHFARGDFDLLTARLDEILAADAKQREALILRGRLKLHEQRFDEAKEDFVNSLERNPSSLTPRFYLREVYLRQKRLVEAREQEESLLSARPAGDEDLPTLTGYADLLVREGRLREAETILEGIVAGQGRVMPQIIISLGHLAIEMHDLEKAMMYADSAVRLAPTYPDGHILRGEIDYTSGRISEALQHFRKALNLSPQHPKALYDMGCVMLYDLEMPFQALMHFQDAARNGFNGPFLSYNIGVARYLLRRPKEALEAFAAVPDYVARATDARWTFANAHLLNADVDSALRIFLELRAAQDKNPALENNIGVAFEMQGDTTEAMKRYWSAIRMARTPDAADTIARSNIERSIRGAEITDRWAVAHTAVPLRLKDIALPKRARRSL